MENVAIPLAAILFFVGKEIILFNHAGSPITPKGYLTYLLEVLTFFVNLIWVAPLAFVKNRRLHFLVRIVVLLAAHHILRCGLAYHSFSKTGFITFVLSADRLMLTIWQVDRPLVLSFLIVVLKTINKRKLEKQQLQLDMIKMQEENMRIESTMAQMQLSPHLLLNGLNYIQTHTREKVPDVAEAISLMGQMLALSLVDVRKNKKVPLLRGLEQVGNRITFHRLLERRSRSLLFTTNWDSITPILKIPPSILMPPIENVLNYGKLNDALEPARIMLNVRDSVLTLQTWNVKRIGVDGGSGIGIASMRRILEFYYPGSFQLDIEETEREYSFSLTINL